MGVLRTWAVGSIVALWHWFFPPKTSLPAETQRHLRELFPALDHDRVRIHDGLPLLVRFSWPNAMTLPGAADTSTVHVYVRRGFLDGIDCETFALCAHEYVHVQQYVAYANGRGLGLFRAFWYVYLLCALRFGYHDNPLEDEAAAFERAVADRCSGGTGMDTVADDLEFRETDIGFVEQFWAGVPGLPCLWRAAQSLRGGRHTGSGGGPDSQSPRSERGRAALRAPAIALAGLLSGVAVAYFAAFALAFLLFTAVVLLLWYVLKAGFVASTAAWALACVPLCATDTLYTGMRRLVGRRA